MSFLLTLSMQLYEIINIYYFFIISIAIENQLIVLQIDQCKFLQLFRSISKNIGRYEISYINLQIHFN